jgi:hypothetical protein
MPTRRGKAYSRRPGSRQAHRIAKKPGRRFALPRRVGGSMQPCVTMRRRPRRCASDHFLHQVSIHFFRTSQTHQMPAAPDDVIRRNVLRGNEQIPLPVDQINRHARGIACAAVVKQRPRRPFHLACRRVVEHAGVQPHVIPAETFKQHESGGGAVEHKFEEGRRDERREAAGKSEERRNRPRVATPPDHENALHLR